MNLKVIIPATWQRDYFEKWLYKIEKKVQKRKYE